MNQLVQFSISEFIQFCHDCLFFIDVNILIGSWKEYTHQIKEPSYNLIYFWLLNDEANRNQIIINQSKVNPTKEREDYLNDYNSYIQRIINGFKKYHDIIHLK